MRLRALLRRDFDQLGAIHQKFYKDEFPLSEMSSLTTSFAVFGDNEELIAAAGIRPIMEAVMITNKDIEISKRREALLEILKTAKETTHHAGYQELHIHVQDYKWFRHLIKYGFNPTLGWHMVTETKELEHG